MIFFLVHQIDLTPKIEPVLKKIGSSIEVTSEIFSNDIS